MTNDTEKRQALDGLREPYNEARNLVSQSLPYKNLEWILGAKKNPGHGAAELNDRTIEVVALWLGDLAVEVDRQGPSGTADGHGLGSEPAGPTGNTVGTRLRLATHRFVTAFRRRLVS